MKARTRRAVESSAWTPDRSALVVFALSSVGALALAFALVSTTRWWTLRQLDAEMLSSFSLIQPWPEILMAALVIVTLFSLLALLPGYKRALAYKLVAGVVIVGALFTGLAVTASTGAAQALQCVDGVARSTASMITGFSLGCVEFRYHNGETGEGLPHGPVLVIEETPEAIWTFEASTGITCRVSTDVIISRASVTASR
ncbi:hypothetical protein [Lentzea sp. NPDC051838]|uniref:hypothetical protein n=1 Tax=Lentzea sp. NPDC051838 TaxID=3154849 RepID=UPI00342C925E